MAAGSSLVDSEESVEKLAGAVDPSALGGVLLAVSRKAAEATSALRAVGDRPCCCSRSSSSSVLYFWLGVATLGRDDIVELGNEGGVESSFFLCQTSVSVDVRCLSSEIRSSIPDICKHHGCCEPRRGHWQLYWRNWERQSI